MQETVIRMTHKLRFDIYVASCVQDGGIYHYTMEDGRMTLSDITRLDRPMYMVIQDRKMYVVLRAPFSSEESGVIVYDIDERGMLINPSEVMSTHGEVACHILVQNEDIYCANYISGSVIKLPDCLVKHEGHSIHPVRQTKPHAHFVGITPDNQYICVSDLGTDTIYFYNKDLTVYNKVEVPSGHGVRHLAFSENGKYLFAVCELASTVLAFSYKSGQLTLLDVQSTVPKDFKGETTTAAIRIKGGYIYVSNRGHNSIAKLGFKHHSLTLIDTIDCGGKTPRDFIFAGSYLLSTNQDSDCVALLNVRNGFIIQDKITVKMPICICAIERRS